MREPTYLVLFNSAPSSTRDGPWAAEYAEEGAEDAGSARHFVADSVSGPSSFGPYNEPSYKLESDAGVYYVMEQDVGRIVNLHTLRDTMLDDDIDLAFAEEEGVYDV